MEYLLHMVAPLKRLIVDLCLSWEISHCLWFSFKIKPLLWYISPKKYITGFIIVFKECKVVVLKTQNLKYLNACLKVKYFKYFVQYQLLNGV